MGLKIIEKKEEPLLSRTKIIAEVDFDAATPPAKEVKSKIASSLGANENLIVIRNIYTNFGFRKADITAYLYKNEKEIENLEPKSKKQTAKGETPEKTDVKPKAEEDKGKKPQESKEEKPKESKEK